MGYNTNPTYASYCNIESPGTNAVTTAINRSVRTVSFIDPLEVVNDTDAHRRTIRRREEDYQSNFDVTTRTSGFQGLRETRNQHVDTRTSRVPAPINTGGSTTESRAHEAQGQHAPTIGLHHIGMGHDPKTVLCTSTSHAERADEQTGRNLRPICRRKRSTCQTASIHNSYCPGPMGHTSTHTDTQKGEPQVSLSPTQVECNQGHSPPDFPKVQQEIRDAVDPPGIVDHSRSRGHNSARITSLLGAWGGANAHEISGMGHAVWTHGNGRTEVRTATMVDLSGDDDEVSFFPQSKRMKRFMRCVNPKGVRRDQGTLPLWSLKHSQIVSTAVYTNETWNIHVPVHLGAISPQLYADMTDDPAVSSDTKNVLRYLVDPSLYAGHLSLDMDTINWPESGITQAQNMDMLSSGLVVVTSNPLGFGYIFLVPEASKHRYRVVTDTLSCNVLCDKARQPTFTPMGTVRRWFCKYKYAATLDMKCCYYQHSLAKEVQRYFSYCFEGDYFSFTRLPMGWINSCPIAHESNLWLIKQALVPGVVVDVYIDNILLLADDTAALLLVIERFQAICRKYNATIGDVTLPTTKVTYRGVELCCERRAVRLGEKSMNKLAERFQSSDGTWAHIQSLIGSIISAYISVGFHLASIFYLLRALAHNFDTPPHQRPHLPQSAVKQLSVARKLLVNRRWIPVADPSDQIAIITDACTDTGIISAIVVLPSGRYFVHSFHVQRSEYENNNDMEALALLRILQHNPDHIFNNKVISYWGDNTAVLFSLRGTYSKSFHLNVKVGRILARIDSLQSRILLRYVDTEANPADAPTRLSHFTSLHRQTLRVVALSLGAGGESRGGPRHGSRDMERTRERGRL